MRALWLAVMLSIVPSVVAAQADGRPCEEKTQWENDACDTPRKGVLSGFYLGVDAGYLSVDKAVRRRTGLGGGSPVLVRLALVFWDHLALELGAGWLGFKDHRPTSERVVDCTRYPTSEPECGKERDQKSQVSTALLSFQLGVQHRFRPTKSFSIVPGAMLGYLISPTGVKRKVACEGCPGGDELDMKLNGLGVEPFLRFTFSELGWISAIVRSRWFLTGDLIQQTTLGLEFGAP